MIYFTFDFLKYLFSCTVFFVEESRGYMSPWNIGDILYYPVAYFSFMKLMVGEYKDFKNEEYDEFR